MVKFSDLRSNFVRQGSAKPVGGVEREVSESRVTFRRMDFGKTSSTSPSHRIQESLLQEPIDEQRLNQVYDEALSYLDGVFAAVRKQKNFDLEHGFEIIQEVCEIVRPDDALFLKSLYSESETDFVVQHSVNVAILSIMLAENLGYNMDRRVEIGTVALLHDVGTVMVPEELITRQGSLSLQELSIVRQRPNYAFDILEKYKEEHPYLAECSHQVYERIDGSGYPMGLKGDEIHEYAQLIGLVDVYEAMIHDRPQRKKFLHFEAVKEIIQTGKRSYRKEYLKALLKLFSVFPLDSYVRLNSKAIGKVILTYPDQPMRPKVQIVYDSQKRKVLTERIINLPDNPLLFVVDSISEEELLELAEASEFLSRPEYQEDTLDDEEDLEPLDDKYRKQSSSDRDFGKKPKRKKGRARRWQVPALFGLTVCLVAALAFQFLPNMHQTGQQTLTATSEPTPAASSPTTLPSDISEKGESEDTAAIVAPQTATDDNEALEAQDIGSIPIPASAAMNLNLSPPPVMLMETEAWKIAPQDLDTAFQAYRTSYPYSIKLTYFKTQEEAVASLPAFRNLGLSPHWVKVDLGEEGVWHRVFAGYYESLGEARTVINSMGLTGAVAKETEYATLIQSYDTEQSAIAAVEGIRARGFSAYTVRGKDDGFYVMVGAFYTRAGAEAQKQDLKSKGIESRIIER